MDRRLPFLCMDIDQSGWLQCCIYCRQKSRTIQPESHRKQKPQIYFKTLQHISSKVSRLHFPEKQCVGPASKCSFFNMQKTHQNWMGRRQRSFSLSASHASLRMWLRQCKCERACCCFWVRSGSPLSRQRKWNISACSALHRKAPTLWLERQRELHLWQPQLTGTGHVVFCTLVVF